MIVTVDDNSGFCFGVTNAIGKAEAILNTESELYCLGEIVHNDVEVDRLSKKGLKAITHDDMKSISGRKVLIRAHGEPPKTYETAKLQGLEIVDASCPVVLKLQQRIRKGYEEIKPLNGQVLIFGKKGHAEVNGLVGQTDNTAIVVESSSDLDAVDFTKPIYLYSQTTKGVDDFNKLSEEIRQKILQVGGNLTNFKTFDTICRQVANRQPKLVEFAKQNDVVIFVSGKKSSNGKVLFETCKKENERTYFVEDVSDVLKSWFKGVEKVGVCGATSTPRWLMDEIAKYISEIKL